ncbi:Hypothetical protein UVM_LOCUS267, partial [uncultured virus]
VWPRICVYTAVFGKYDKFRATAITHQTVPHDTVYFTTDIVDVSPHVPVVKR